jgi:thiol-disulfide isomerase/thioredoxin
MKHRANKYFIPKALLVPLLLFAVVASAQSDVAVEERIVNYLKKNVTPGRPLIVSELYNKVFPAPEERKALDRLFNAFFKIPVFVAQYKAGTNRIPTLADIARQFNLQISGEVQVLLTIMDSDPRVPKFIIQDAKTGEITNVDIEAVKRDKRFSQAIERTMSGWVGKSAPAFEMDLLNGTKLRSADLSGRNYLIYFWFSGCPPCVQLSPHLVRLEKQYGGKRFTVIAVNADRFLELDTTDIERSTYVKKQRFQFPVAHLNKKMNEEYGSPNVFPMLFLVDAHGIIRKQYIGYQSPELLAADIKDLLASK